MAMPWWLCPDVRGSRPPGTFQKEEPRQSWQAAWPGNNRGCPGGTGRTTLWGGRGGARSWCQANPWQRRAFPRGAGEPGWQLLPPGKPLRMSEQGTRWQQAVLPSSAHDGAAAPVGKHCPVSPSTTVLLKSLLFCIFFF